MVQCELTRIAAVFFEVIVNERPFPPYEWRQTFQIRCSFTNINNSTIHFVVKHSPIDGIRSFLTNSPIHMVFSNLPNALVLVVYFTYINRKFSMSIENCVCTFIKFCWYKADKEHHRSMATLSFESLYTHTHISLLRSHKLRIRNRHYNFSNNLPPPTKCFVKRKHLIVLTIVIFTQFISHGFIRLLHSQTFYTYFASISFAPQCLIWVNYN